MLSSLFMTEGAKEKATVNICAFFICLYLDKSNGSVVKGCDFVFFFFPYFAHDQPEN